MKLMRTISWNPHGPSVDMIDQRLLPGEYKIIHLTSSNEVAQAIMDMAIRGAPAIGAAGALGLALAAQESQASETFSLIQDIEEAAELLRGTRPTAVNLGWALDRMLTLLLEIKSSNLEEIRECLLKEAKKLADEDVEINRRMGEHGATLIPDQATVIHHCNTGALATVDYGTALGVIRTAHEQGKRIHVLVDETRPRLQGARLTAWELEQYGISYEIITDNAAGFFLSSGIVNAVLVGADRVAANGDVVNKIGTYMLALAAQDNNVPFYAVFPTSTVDMFVSSGKEIPIEERDPSEVLNLERQGKPIAPSKSQARNPAFDITPHRLISALVTEVGVLHPPYKIKLREAVERARKS
jgi:methylthioribose-1-phosphate isomerase